MFTSAESFTLCDVTWESQSSPFDQHYGLVIDEATDEVVRAHVPVREHLLQPVGLVHGGVHASIAEALASFGTNVGVVPDGNIGLGMSNNSTFLRSIGEGTIHATARRVHRRTDDLGLGRRAEGRRRQAVRREPRHDRGAAAENVIRIVVPYAGSRGKTRLGAKRSELSAAMLTDVLAVTTSVGETWVVSPEPVEGATWIPDPGGGQGAAVQAALQEIGPGPVLVVNSDLPTLTPDDLRALGDAIPERGIAIAPAGDGTTNALGLSGRKPLRAPLRAGQRSPLPGACRACC